MTRQSLALALILFVGLVIAGWLDSGGPARPMATPAIPTAIIAASPTAAPRPWQAEPTPTPTSEPPTPTPTPVLYVDGQVVSDLTPLP